MKLSYEQLTAITCGSVRTWEDELGFHACRFTQSQQEAYRGVSLDFYEKSFATSGIALRFRTDSPFLWLDVTALRGSSRSYFSVDVEVNGQPLGCLDNFSQVPLPQDYTQVDVPLGNHSGSFELGAGEKTVCIRLPWSVRLVIRSLELADGASLTPVKPGKKLLAFGDSITHGYDALRPSNKYITKLAEALEMEEHNKAIGGDFFFPGLAGRKDELRPDLITVAYGTNDWSNHTLEVMERNCAGFFQGLHRSYPETPIVVITPIWRKDCDRVTGVGSFSDADALLDAARCG